jgi:glycosyltransferase involved in cell wall biosynthesis
MRALVISHTYVAEDNCAKWNSLTSSHLSEIELHLPHQWPSWESHYYPRPCKEGMFSKKVSRILRPGREDQYIFMPHIFRGIKKGKFDILHVEQGAGAFVYFQSLLERNLFSRSTKTCFFTWINWETPLRWPWTFIEPYNLRNSNGAIGGNRESVSLLKKHGFRGKTTVIPQLGVDTTYYSPALNLDLRKKLGLEGVVLGFVGRLVEEKGIKILLKAAKQLGSNFTLLFVGNGALEPELKKSYPFKIVHVPSVPHDEVRDYLRAMDIFILPSYSIPRWKEQFGHVLIEAMACEIPVIGSTSAAIPEVIGQDGLLFEEKNSEDLAEKLKSLISNTDERIRLGKKGRKRVLENFTHELIAQQTLEFWKTL